MDDTPPEVRKIYRRMLMDLSPEDRFIKGIQMFNAARTIVLASLKKELSDKELKTFLFDRFYGKELGDQVRIDFLAQIK